MELRPDEERILNGEEGESRRKAMELLVALGKVYGAEDLIGISSAHLSGASYKTIGDGGLKYLSDQVGGGAKVSVPATLNPVGMDLCRWKEMHISEEFAVKQ
ncbi:MAG: aconitase X, partial [Candidatus Methanomethylophilaceae archaeon]|nr:aconitase X [Candidatus Methanomethylophilaceae archaeon]